MKTFRFLLFVVCLSLSQMSFAQSSNDGGNPPENGNTENTGGTGAGNQQGNNDGEVGGLNGDGPKHMELLGETEAVISRSLSLPFEAFICNESLTIVSLCNLNDVSIEIISSVGEEMYAVTQSVYFTQEIIIPVAAYPTDYYTAIISTPTGTYLTGSFSH